MTKSFECDVLVIGTGVAGLSCAYELASKGVNVTIVTKAQAPDYTNTCWAQGGIIYPSSSDEKLIDDVRAASAGTANLEAAKVLLSEGREAVDDLLLQLAETDFERGPGGELKLTMEAAHSTERILYRGDFTGKEIQSSLLRALSDRSKFPTLSFLTNHTAIDLITPGHHGVDYSQRYEEHKVVGAYLLDSAQGLVKKVMAKTTVLATGGIGSLYLHHTNTNGARGDGHAMARRAGAQVIDLEFVQFHPTTLYARGQHRRFLISEAVRGEGGVLLNSSGEAFMDKYHPSRELAPRDIVSRSIHQEMIDREDPCVYLDISHKEGAWIERRFPTIFGHCLEHKIDIRKDPIPVVPAAHYTCGGVKANLHGETTVSSLYAVGEVACTGLHGANRLASTSLLEGLTFGRRAGRHILEHSMGRGYQGSDIQDWIEGEDPVDKALIHQDLSTLRQTMWNYVGISRSRPRLQRARAIFRELSDEIYRFYKNAKLTDELIGLRNSVEVAGLVVSASIRNTKSVGCFYVK